MNGYEYAGIHVTPVDQLMQDWKSALVAGIKEVEHIFFLSRHVYTNGWGTRHSIMKSNDVRISGHILLDFYKSGLLCSLVYYEKQRSDKDSISSWFNI